MNPISSKDKPPNIVFQEYSKDVIAFFKGHGSVFHTVKVICKDPESATIEHRFGADEGFTPFYGHQISLKDANQNLLKNNKRSGEQDFAFGIFGLKPPGFIEYKELPSLENEKRFQINWKNVLGTVKKAAYVWVWDRGLMFATSDRKEQHKSLLKVVYPTKKLTFRLIVNSFYPIEGNPCIAVIDPKGEETLFMQAYPVELKSEKLSFNYHSIQSSKCFKIEIINPKLGFTYEMRWSSKTLKLENLIN